MPRLPEGNHSGNGTQAVAALPLTDQRDPCRGCAED